MRDALAESVINTGRVVDEDAEALLPGQLDGQHLGAGQGRLDQTRNVAPEHSFLFLLSNRHPRKPPSANRIYKKWAPRAHPENARNVVSKR